MSCNCSQKRKMTGFGTVKPQPAPKPISSTQQTFTLKKPDGSKQVFGSKLEALAARIRAGGGTIE